MFSITFLLEAAFWFLIIAAIVHRVTRSNQSSKRTGRTPDYQTYYKNQGTNMQPKEQRVTPNYQAPQQRVTPNYQAPQQRVAPNYQAPQQRVTPNHQAPQQRVAPNHQAPQQRVTPNYQAPQQRVTPNYQAPHQRVAPNVQQKAAKRQITPEERKRLEQYRAEKEARPQILERAASNAAKYKENQTNESLLGNIEDLMVKGYDGELSFERDFVAEALDMINSFI